MRIFCFLIFFGFSGLVGRAIERVWSNARIVIAPDLVNASGYGSFAVIDNASMWDFRIELQALDHSGNQVGRAVAGSTSFPDSEPKEYGVTLSGVSSLLPNGGSLVLLGSMGPVNDPSSMAVIATVPYGSAGGLFHYGFMLENTDADEACVVMCGTGSISVAAGETISWDGSLFVTDGQFIDFRVPAGWHAESNPGSIVVQLTDGNDYRWNFLDDDPVIPIRLVKDAPMRQITVKVRVFDASSGNHVVAWAGGVKVGEFDTLHDAHFVFEQTVMAEDGAIVSLDGVPANVHVIASPDEKRVGAGNTYFYWDLYIPPSGAGGDGGDGGAIVEAIEHFEETFKAEDVSDTVKAEGRATRDTLTDEGGRMRESLDKNTGRIVDAINAKDLSVSFNPTINFDDSGIIGAVEKQTAHIDENHKSLMDLLGGKDADVSGVVAVLRQQGEALVGQALDFASQAASAGEDVVGQFGSTVGVAVVGVPSPDFISLGVIGGKEIRIPKDPFSAQGPFGGVMASVAAFIRRLIAWGIVVAFFLWVMGEFNKAVADGFKVAPMPNYLTDLVGKISFLGNSLGVVFAVPFKLATCLIVFGFMITLPVLLLAAATAGFPWSDLKTIYAAGVPAIADDSGSGVSLARAWGLADKVIPLILVLSVPLYCLLVRLFQWPARLGQMFLMKFLTT
jgi:hypothetical protein